MQQVNSARPAGVCVPWRSAIPRHPQSNGRQERLIGVTGDGARSLLLQAGTPDLWWSWAMIYWCITSTLVEGAYRQRHGEEARLVNLLPFGCAVTMIPVVRHRKGHKFAPRAVRAYLLYYHTEPGGSLDGSA